MILREENGNLFEVDEKYYLAHCVSSDVEMGQGIALDFNKNFKLKNKLFSYDEEIRECPTCIKVDRVFNLITKAKYWNKPTYESLRGSLEVMRDTIIKDNIKYLAMPKIGCGLDRLQWGLVREIIKDIFKDIEIEILVMHL